MQIKAAVLYEQSNERQYTRSQPLAIETAELDDPADGELLVEIAVAGLCHSDYSTIEGIRPREGGGVRFRGPCSVTLKLSRP